MFGDGFRDNLSLAVHSDGLLGLRSVREIWWQACFLVWGKFPDIVAKLKYLLLRYLGKAPRVIEDRPKLFKHCHSK